jgi:transcriptional regulator GlxA family with amidase domain
VVLPPGIATGFAVPAACERYALKVSGAAVEAVLEGLGINCGVVYAAGPPPGELFRRLYRAMNDPSPAGLIEASSCTYELFALLARRRRRARTDPVVRRALSILETAWADAGLNAAVLADRTGVHRSVLTEGFRKAFGIGPATYLRRLRVRRALALLEEGSRPVQEVAAACGVPGASQFSRLIRRATGLSPRRIREGA